MTDSKNGNVLFVDDEIEVINSLKRQLRKSDFNTYFARGSKEAEQIMSERNIHIIITDERMPGKSGVELLREIKENHPDTIRILLSGYADTKVIIDSINHGEVYRFVSKPWDKETLTDAISDGFAQYRTHQKNKTLMKTVIEENRLLRKELNQRDTPLFFSEEIINAIPKPVIILADDGLITIINESARTLFNCRPGPEENIRNLVSPDTAERLIEGLKLPGGQKKIMFSRNGHTITAFTRVLRPQDPYIGLLFFETGRKGD